MAAGENEPQPVVLHGPNLLGRVAIEGLRAHHGRLAEQLPLSCRAAQTIDGAIPCSGRDPAAWVWRQAVDRPALKGDRERVLDSILGDVDVAEAPDESGDGSTGLLAEDPADLRGVDRARRPVRPSLVSHQAPRRLPRRAGLRSDCR